MCLLIPAVSATEEEENSCDEARKGRGMVMSIAALAPLESDDFAEVTDVDEELPVAVGDEFNCVPELKVGVGVD
jgi:hypothetical protein